MVKPDYHNCQKFQKLNSNYSYSRYCGSARFSLDVCLISHIDMRRVLYKNMTCCSSDVFFFLFFIYLAPWTFHLPAGFLVLKHDVLLAHI